MAAIASKPLQTKTAPKAEIVVAVGVAQTSYRSLQAVFSRMPSDVQAAFVVVFTHTEGLTPEVMAEDLAALSGMPAQVCSTPRRPETRHIYVAPAGCNLIAVDGELVPEQAEEPLGRRGSIDSLLTSLAAYLASHAVGVLLDGVAPDGVAGVVALKEHGGLAVAEVAQAGDHAAPPPIDPRGLVDLILPAEAIPQQIASYVAHLETSAPRAGARKQVDRIIDRYAPIYALVDDNYDVLQFSERTGGFIEPMAGAATLNLLNLVRRELRADLRAALHAASAERRRIQVDTADLPLQGAARRIELIVEPVAETDRLTGFLVLFRDNGPALTTAVLDATDAALLRDQHAQRLEAELRHSNESLQATIDELETSKEELQSVNEELRTVNGELGYRVAELARANSDLRNLLDNTQIATIFLDNDMRVKSFTPSIADVFNLIDSDLGRPITDIAARIDYPELRDDVRRVLRTLAPVEREVAGHDNGACYLIRVLPYRSVDNFISGTVLTFADVTDVVRARLALGESEARYRTVVESATDYAIITMDADRRITGWNPGAANIFGWSEGEMIGKSGDTIFTAADQAEGAPEAEADAAVQEGRALDHRWHVRRDGARFWASGVMMPLKDPEQGFVKILHDRTQERENEERQKLLMAELQHRVKNILAVVRSIASRTLETTDDLDDFSAHFDGRLRALARTQNVLTRTTTGRIDLDELVREELLTHAPQEPGQIEISGPDLTLRDRAAEIFALALHELATNAVKYGALSQPKGRIAVTWRVLNAADGSRLSLEWRETGVPALDPNPARRGFGRDLIERGLPYELGAATSLEFLPGGVRCTIELPLDEGSAIDTDSLKWSTGG